MRGCLFGGVSLFAALFLEQVPAELLQGLLQGGPITITVTTATAPAPTTPVPTAPVPTAPVPVGIPSPPHWERDDVAVLEAVPEAVPFPARFVAFDMGFQLKQLKARLLDDERGQGLNLLAFGVLLNSVLFIWRPQRVPQKRRFGRLIFITC
jgi:hypothetical protein